MKALNVIALALAGAALIACSRPTISDRAANPQAADQEFAARVLSDTKIAVAGCGAYLNEGVGFEALESEGFSKISLFSDNQWATGGRFGEGIKVDLKPNESCKIFYMDSVRGLNEAFELAQNALVEAGYELRDTIQFPRRTEFIYEKNGEDLNLTASWTRNVVSILLKI